MLVVLFSLFAVALMILTCIVVWSVTVRQYEKKMEQLDKHLKKVQFDLSSIRVKHGQSWETFLPLMSKFEEQLGPKENAIFLGRPIDLIYFNKDELVFVEIKTGKSTLSSKQRRIRNHIQQHKIRWEEVSDA